MRRLATAVLLAVTACAHHVCPVHPVTPSGHVFLWRADAPGGRGSIYLFGTYHIAGEADVPAVAWQKLHDATIFMTELDDPDPAELDKLTRLPHEQSLEAMIPPDAWLDLRDALEGVVKPETLARYRPWYAMSLLTGAAYHAPVPSMDSALHRRAVAQHARLAFLESWAEQLGAVDKSVGPSDLVQAIHDDRDRMRCELDGVMAAYRAGDLAALTVALETEHADELLRARNLRWIDEIVAEQAKDGAVLFVSVGVGHMTGPDSLPELLGARGYEVTRL